MLAQTLDLFEEASLPSRSEFHDAFEAWISSRAQFGVIRENSSVAVYRSMWGALTAWCVSQGLRVDELQAADFEAFLLSRGQVEQLTPRHAWRLLTLADSVLTYRADAKGFDRNTAARDLLISTPVWRFANSADRTPLPDHLCAAEARRLVIWLLNPGGGEASDDDAGHTWQWLRNRTAVALQLGAGLTPGDVRAATVDGVVTEGSRVAGLPWKLQLPRRGAIPAREAPIAPWAARLLRRWLDTRSALLIGGLSLFPAALDGRPWSKVSQYSSAKAVLTAAGLPDQQGGSFKLRHTFALRQLRRGTAPETVAEWMGVSDAAVLTAYRRVRYAADTPV